MNIGSFYKSPVKWELVLLSMKFRGIFKTHNFGLNYSNKTLIAELILWEERVSYYCIEAGLIPGASLSVSEHLITHSLRFTNYINLLRIESQCFLFLSIILENNSITSEKS